MDLVGIRHMQLLIACMEETNDSSISSQRSSLLEWIVQVIKHTLDAPKTIVRGHLLEFLQRSPSITCDPKLTTFLVDSLQDANVQRQVQVLQFISELSIDKPPNTLISSVISRLDDVNPEVRQIAYSALGHIGEKAPTNEVISKLVSALGDQSAEVRWSACSALGHIGEKAATN